MSTLQSTPTEPYYAELPLNASTRHPNASPINATEITMLWAEKFNTVLDSHDVSNLSSLFSEDCWWRDALAVSWNFRTIHSLSKLTGYLEENLLQSNIRNVNIRRGGAFPPSLQNPTECLEWCQAMFDFETTFGSGVGVLRLVLGNEGDWKAFTISTSLQSLNGHPENVGLARPHGGNNSLNGSSIGDNWLKRRQKQAQFEHSNPDVLVIGAGQAGLNIAARLQQFNITVLIIDKNSRIGDNWRNRYRTLVTHDPVHYCHMAYLPFPTSWPMFTAKDKLGDWFEAYASLMELNVWTNTNIDNADYDEGTKIWTVQLRQADEGTRTIFPKHVVFCTGQAGEPKVDTFPGQEAFEGTIYHSSQHQDASASGSVKGKRVVVVGTGNSGHDIAQNFFESGADVTMLQRSGTYVLTARTGLFMLHTGMYEENGPPTEEADIVGQSLPIPVQFALNVGLTRRISEAEKKTRAGLTNAGFLIDDGQDSSGIYRKYITRGGGYYIDVGGSQLIIDGKIKVVRSPDGISDFNRTSIRLADGQSLPADIVVLATGYDNMRTSVRKILGDKVANRCKDVWGLDDEGEVNTMWRDSGHPGFWYMGGSLALCRIYSKYLALQIKAVEEGLMGGGEKRVSEGQVTL